jgi:hypothetical protein
VDDRAERVLGDAIAQRAASMEFPRGHGLLERAGEVIGSGKVRFNTRSAKRCFARLNGLPLSSGPV